MRPIVFYSWMTGRPSSTNRGFVEDALLVAVKVIANDGAVEIAPRVDQATAGVPGAPSISATIFEKIDRADIFVGDVTLMALVEQESGRATPNPNVLVELGYALKALGPDRIILVFNKAFGDPKDLPFDIRDRRVTAYEMPEAAERATERKKLAKQLEEAIRSVIEHVEGRAQGVWLGSIARQLIELQIAIEDFELSNGSYSIQIALEAHAATLRELSREPAAEHSAELKELADLCDEIAASMEHDIHWDVDTGIEKAKPLVGNLKTMLVDSIKLADSTRDEVSIAIRDAANDALELVSRMDKYVERGRIDRLQQEAAAIGRRVLWLVDLPIAISSARLTTLRAATRALARVSMIELMVDGGETLNEITTAIRDSSATLDDISRELNA